MPDNKTISTHEKLEQLQFEEAMEVADERRRRRIERQHRREGLELTIKRDRENQERIQAACAHRKGGKGTQQLYAGNDQNYSVITHTLSHGPTVVICQRCWKIWEPPVRLPKNATAEMRAKYREDLAEYNRARAFPTDNEPSGTVLFAFHEPEFAHA